MSASGLAKGRDVWYRNDNQANVGVRHADEPAPTVLFGNRMNSVEWIHERPATAVCGDPRVHPPGHKVNAEDVAAGRDGYDGRAGKNAVRVTVQEAAVLQSFPAEFPWQGSRSAQFRQIGNAIPPKLAHAILAALLKARDPR